MGGDRILSHRAMVAPLLLAALLCLPASPASGPDPFPVRMVKLGGRPADAATREHLEFSHSLGFNAVWVYSHQAGRWDARGAPDGPFLDPEFLEVAGWCREHGMRVFVSVNPWAGSGGTLVYSEKAGEKRIGRFIKLLRRDAGVRDFVVSFDDQPIDLSNLSDIVRYGRSAAPAHIDLVRRLERRVRRDETIWFAAAAYCDEHLADGTPPYVAAFLSGLPDLPERVGIVWSGPDVISRAIGADDIARTRERLGGRSILLYDNYPINDDGKGTGLALVLGPLRFRDPGLRDEVAAYLACPMRQLGASRLPLMTIADFLRDPEGYEADKTWNESIDRLAGPEPGVAEALRAQTKEWGGWVGTATYRPARVDNARRSANLLGDEGYAATLARVVEVYPARMDALSRIEDESFRDDLLETMGRRLAVARAYPLVREYAARVEAGREDVEALVSAIEAERDRWRGQPGVQRALNVLLIEAGYPTGRGE